MPVNAKEKEKRSCGYPVMKEFAEFVPCQWNSQKLGAEAPGYRFLRKTLSDFMEGWCCLEGHKYECQSSS